QYRDTGRRALCVAGSVGDPRCTICNSAPRHRSDWQSLRAHYVRMVFGDRGDGRRGHNPTPRRACGLEPALWFALPALERFCELSHSRWRFLWVTGAEALYADMGHFGSRPIRFTWSVIVFPSLLLNYAGQSAIVLEGTPTTDNIFYRLCPELLLIPFVILATIAT